MANPLLNYITLFSYILPTSKIEYIKNREISFKMSWKLNIKDKFYKSTVFQHILGKQTEREREMTSLHFLARSVS